MSDAQTAPLVRRIAARILLIDGRDRLLLFRGGDPSNAAAGTWWFTVGGGLDEGESVLDGAVRELFEETGLRCEPADLGVPVHTEETEFDFGGQRFAQHHTFFVLRVDALEVDTSGFEELEVDSIVEHRWWTRDELRATQDSVFPRGLVELLDRIA